MCPKVTSRHIEELKEKIIQSALECFSESGFDKTRMEDIALSSGLSKGTLYNYFKSKDDLFYAICEDNIKILKNQLDRMFTNSKNDLIFSAEQFYENFTDMQKKGNEKVFFEAIAESSRNPKLQKILHDHRIRILNIAKEYLDLQVKKGFFHQNFKTEYIASGLVALFDGITAGKLLGIPDEHSKRVWAETVKSLFIGLS